MNVMGLDHNPRPVRNAAHEAEFKRLADEQALANPDKFPLTYARLMATRTST